MIPKSGHRFWEKIMLNDKATNSFRGLGRGRLARRRLARLPLLLLDDAGRLAAPAAQVIELGAAHLAAAHHLDRVDHRRIEREHALDAFAVGNLTHGEVLVEPAAGAADAHALVGLHAAAVTLHHLDVDEQRVARCEVGDILAGGEFGDLLLLELLDEVHGKSPSRRRGDALSRLSGAGRRAYTTPARVCHLPVVLPGCAARQAHKSGRRSRVSRSASARRNASTLPWSPDSSTCGIGRPSNTCGRVYCGYSKSPWAKLSSAPEACAPMTPGISRTQASISAMAAISPPEST